MRKQIGGLAVVLGFAAGLTSPAALRASSWLMPGHDAQATHFNRSEDTLRPANIARLRVAWAYPRVLQAISTQSSVYAIVGNGFGKANVVILNSRTGARERLFTAAALHLSPGLGDVPQVLGYSAHKLVIAATREVVAVNLSTGRPIWRMPGGATFLTVVGNIAYTGKGCQYPCGTMASYAINISTGRKLWTHPGNFGGPPVLVAGRLYQVWGEYRGETRVYDPVHGQLLARLPFSGQWTGDTSTRFVEDFTGGRPTSQPIKFWIGRISSTGKPVWKVNLGAPEGGYPVFAYQSLFVPSNRFHPGVVALNASNGHLRWAADAGQVVALSAAGNMLFTLDSTHGQVVILGTGQGHVIKRVKIPGYVNGSVADLFPAAGHLYVLDGRGMVALRP